MKGKASVCFYVVMLLLMMSWSGVETSRLFAANHRVHGTPPPLHQPEPLAPQSPQSLPPFKEYEDEEVMKNKIGSMPPKCEDKCYGCTPCEAIQVPTTTSRVGVQYANYEPEDWKCKCGPAFYSP